MTQTERKCSFSITFTWSYSRLHMTSMFAPNIYQISFRFERAILTFHLPVIHWNYIQVVAVISALFHATTVSENIGQWSLGLEKQWIASFSVIWSAFFFINGVRYEMDCLRTPVQEHEFCWQVLKS